MRKLVAAAILLSFASPMMAAKPPSGGGGGGGGSAANHQIAYRSFSGQTVKLMFANENGSSAVSLYSSPAAFRFDLAPRADKRVAIVSGQGAAGRLYVLNYVPNTFGGYTTSLQDLTEARSGGNPDFSPDGTKIAYPCCWDGTNEKLAVYDLTDGSITYWASGPYFWDIAWFRDGASIAYSSERSLYEVAGPGAQPQFLFTGHPGGELNVDAGREDNDMLVVSYNDLSGDARIGLWKGGSMTNPDIANSARSWQGTLSCDDKKLAYMGNQSNSNSQAFYIRTLATGTTTQVSKNSNILLQFWPTC